MHQDVNKVRFGFAVVEFRPILQSEQDWYTRRWIGYGKRLVLAQRFLQLRQRETGIDGKKCSAGLHHLHRRARTAALAKLVAEQSEQRLRVFASGNANHTFGACE